MKNYHNIKNIQFVDNVMKITIDDKEYIFDLTKISSRLSSASQAERENYVISSSGYGIHWPSIDEDLSIDGLLGIKRQPQFTQKTSLIN